MTSARRQVRVAEPGGPEVLVAEDAPMPVPATGELLVAMEAAGVAFGDVTQRQGRNPGAMPPVLGYDVVGKVVATGPDVVGFAVGQRVTALTVVGGYASHVITQARWSVAVPTGLPAAEVTALTLNYLTAWQMLHRVAHVRAGQTLLVLGAAGGVGSALVELGRLAGARVLGTASGPRQALLRQLGVEVVPEAAAVREPVDVTFDPVGGPSLPRSRRATRRAGLVVSYGFSFAVDSGRSRWGGLALALVGLLRAKLTPGARVATFYVTASAARDPAALREDLDHLVRLLAEGVLQPRVETMPLSRAADAHRRLENREVSGKLVLVAD